ncbi:pro-neuregulin-1, membrane-bound isoform 1-T1 [Synchiropus picturatus]
MEDISAGPEPASPSGSTVDTGQVPEEKPEETEAAAVSGEENAGGTAEGGGSGDGEHSGALGIMALPGTCCVCIEMEQINNCLHSEKICILPILACLLSLALCTAGLKWVFADKIFEYEPPTHLDPKPIGQDPFTILVDPTLGLTVSIPPSSSATVTSTTVSSVTSGRPEVFLESTRGPYVPPRVTESDPSVTLKSKADRPTIPKQTPHHQTTQEINDIFIPTISSTSTTSTTKTSSHVTRCSDRQKNYCVNGGECFTLEIMPGSTKFLCRCPNEFTGDRCQTYVMASFYKRFGIEFMEAEELYQKRILTISGICIALLVVGIMCVVAYCKTKKQRQKLQDRLRQNLRNKRKNSARGRQVTALPLQDLQSRTQCNGTTALHTNVNETETTCSASKYALSAQESTALTQISSQRCESAVAASSDFHASAATPGSPPSEMSAPLSSLAVSVPSVALSPSAEEERPLLLSRTRQRPPSRDELKRTSAHYNHGHDAHSLPSSPLTIVKNSKNLNSTAANPVMSSSHEDLVNTNNILNSLCSKAEIINGHVPHKVECGCGCPVVESEPEGPPGSHAFFFSTGMTCRASSRTNPASALDDPPIRSSSATQHALAV